MNRREVAFGAAAAVGAAALPGMPAAAGEFPKAVRVGYQKSSILLLLKANGFLEKRLAAQGIAVTWANFEYGPPLLEALGAGAIDYGSTGNAPPIFAQAAHAKLVYAEAIPARGRSFGIVVAHSSPIRTIADLKGKKIGVAKGSSAHDLLVVAIADAGLDWRDITPIYLKPADAAAAFSRGAIDAWSIWDPFLAIAEVQAGARQLPLDPKATAQNSFLLANRDFAAAYPDLLQAINGEVEKVSQWADAHREEAALLFSEASGVSLDIEKRVVVRADYTAGPLTDEIIARQQAVADRFYKLGLIPEKIQVSEIVWHRKAAT